MYYVFMTTRTSHNNLVIEQYIIESIEWQDFMAIGSCNQQHLSHYNRYEKHENAGLPVIEIHNFDIAFHSKAAIKHVQVLSEIST